MFEISRRSTAGFWCTARRKLPGRSYLMLAILTNKAHLRETAREMIRRGIYPRDGGWNGWLGRYQKALVDATFALEQEKAKGENDAGAEALDGSRGTLLGR
jgi:hypothetical protein